MGQVIGIVVAKESEVARRAGRLVKVQYQELPAVLTMEEAIARQSYHLEPHYFGVSRDAVEDEFANCEIVPQKVAARTTVTWNHKVVLLYQKEMMNGNHYC
ncbi:hypothetical protein COOONC_28666 [Cooperia oncophora]